MNFVMRILLKLSPWDRVKVLRMLAIHYNLK
jgi:hypothetical protein